MLYKKLKDLSIGKLFLFAVLIGLIASLTLLLKSTSLYAANSIPVDCPDGYQTTVVRADQVEAACANHQTGDSGSDDRVEPGFSMECTNGPEGSCGIIDKTIVFINAASVIVGVVIVIMIIVGGIQYSSAGSDPQKIASAKSKIVNALIALLTFIFLYSFLQWVVPGGVF